MKLLLTLLFVIIFNFTFCQEICDNGIDDDNDGLIDLNDDDCDCGEDDWLDVPSFLPNAGFEDYNDCPDKLSQLDKCNGWIQGSSSGTSDYYNTCGITSVTTSSSGHLFRTPIQGKHNGNGYVGFLNIGNPTNVDYKEYIGACLPSFLVAGTTYKFKFLLGFGTKTPGADRHYQSLTNFNITIFGTQMCSKIPFSGQECPKASSTGFVELASKTVSGNDEWVTVEVEFTPSTTIKAIVIGPDCISSITNTHNKEGEYYFLDALILNDINLFPPQKRKVNIHKTGLYCNNNFQIVSDLAQNETIQWYKDGIAIIGEINKNLQIDSSDRANYSFVITDINNNCSISNKINTNEIQNCNSQTSDHYIYVANSFSPNNDSHNDIFKPILSNKNEIKNYTFQIFNKWGQLIFETINPSEGWNGTHNNIKCKQDIYVWKYSLTKQGNISKEEKTGHVSLIK